MQKWMIYGAYGYTGKLIAQEAVRRGLQPVLAGRDARACKKVAEDLDLEWRSFACDSASVIAGHLKDMDLVLHCAGPFSATSRPMLDACIESQTDYLDITGEIPVFENIHSQSERLRQAGVVAIPGVGFDVVPSDGLAAILHERLPGASHLSLAFKPSGKMSPGTSKTMIEGLGQGGAIRENGVIKTGGDLLDVRAIRFDKENVPSVTIPWGDVSTAFYSTGIPNVRVYLGSDSKSLRGFRVMRRLSGILALPLFQKGLKSLAGRFVKGPSQQDRDAGKTLLWGEAALANGDAIELRMRVPEGYALTVQTALASVERVLRGDVKPGAWTPSQAFGRDFILKFDGVELIS